MPPALPKLVDTEKITINLGLIDLSQIDLLVQEGFYSNRVMQDAMRLMQTGDLEAATRAIRDGLPGVAPHDIEWSTQQPAGRTSATAHQPAGARAGFGSAAAGMNSTAAVIDGEFVVGADAAFLCRKPWASRRLTQRGAPRAVKSPQRSQRLQSS